MSPVQNRSHRPGFNRRTFLKGAAALGVISALPCLPSARAQSYNLQEAAARRWVLGEFTPSTLSFEEQMAEMAFFIRAAEPFRGREIYVVSETIPTHVYESRFLARAFREITGISVVHDLIREGDLIERLQIQRPELKERFRAKYGYDLGVPVNWKAYEEIADFFTNDVQRLDGIRVWGHMDYGKKSPDLGWRFTDAWLSMAGVGDPGLPNGHPVDEWGIRVEDCHPVGSSVSRGGALNSPAAVYGLRKYIEWLKQYAPPEALKMNFSKSGPYPGRDGIAQQIFWYTAFTSDLLKKGLPVVDNDGTPRWRVAPSPHPGSMTRKEKAGPSIMTI